MRLNLSVTIESTRSAAEITAAIQQQEDCANRLISESFWLRCAGFRFAVFPGKGEARISRLNPLWDYTVLKVLEKANGCLIQVKTVPRLSFEYLFVFLATIYCGMLFFGLGYYLLVGSFYVVFALMMATGFYEKHKSFSILVSLARKVTGDRGGEQMDESILPDHPEGV